MGENITNSKLSHKKILSMYKSDKSRKIRGQILKLIVMGDEEPKFQLTC